MSPGTHFFTGWVLANLASLSRRERVLVTLACVAPDVDGLGVVADYFTRNSPHPLEWFSTYHHSLHSLPFAIVVAAMSFALATQRWKTAGMAFLSFHIHLLEDLLGSRGECRSRRVAHSIPSLDDCSELQIPRCARDDKKRSMSLTKLDQAGRWDRSLD